MYVINREALFKYQGINFFERHLGVMGFATRKLLLGQLSLESQKMPLCVVGKHVFIIDLHFGHEKYNPNLHSILHEYRRQNFDLESRNLVVGRSSQADVKMIRNSIGIHSVQRDLGFRELVPRKFLNHSLWNVGSDKWNS